MKILMALMGLEIGGAETHVVELSKALSKKGYEIVVASNGGVYQKELEESGIRHVKVPLHSKKPWLFLKSYFALAKLFKNEHFDIVHAHARIPAFICGLLSKKHTFRFVTTAHWVFKITPLWQRLANWGEKTIAVSEDIKDYLIENYGVWSDNVSTTINGIDTDKFSKSTDWSDIKEEFSLQEDRYRILYVSRMDVDRSAVAFMVAEAMPEILKLRPNAELVIVGDGNDFARLKEHTDAINDSIGHKAIILTGARVDINKFVASSDVFVGVSRSALEAMAAGIPVVIAGNEGYIGIFDESKFDISYETNYCCRGCPESTTELILNDLVKLATASNEDLNKISEYNKHIIHTMYSAEKMSGDYADMYNTLNPLTHYKYGDVIINGYYGYKNTGDDALLQAMIENVRATNKNARITVLSASPKETSYRYSVNSIHRYNVLRILKEMKHASLFISGGGSLLQDVTSTKSLFYYSEMIKLAKRFGMKIMIYANGFGPINKKKNLDVVKKSLLCADYISMREPQSASELKELLPQLDIQTTADPAFSLGEVSDAWKTKLLAKLGLESGKNYFAVSVRDWQDNDKNLTEKIAEFCNHTYTNHNLIPVFVSMQNSKDLAISEKIIDKLSCPSVLISKVTAKELISILGDMTFTIGMRLHFLVFSVISATPPIPLSYDPKIISMIKYIGLDAPLNASNVDLDALINKANYIIDNRDILSKHLSDRRKEMHELNLLDAKKANSLINS